MKHALIKGAAVAAVALLATTAVYAAPFPGSRLA